MVRQLRDVPGYINRALKGLNENLINANACEAINEELMITVNMHYNDGWE